MVLNVVGSVVGLVKVRMLHTDVDNYIFRLHYRWTTSFCYLACALVAASDYIGTAIQCVDGSGDGVPKAFNTYCWIRATYSINSTKSEHAHYGTGTYDPATHVMTQHAYYQWVPFVLFFQGCLFYLPHLLWKALEGKTADTLLQGLQFNPLDDDRQKKKENIIKYLQSSRGRNGRYSGTYMVCEVLNLANVLAQMFLLNAFFGGAFIDFGTQVINFALAEDDTRHDPMIMTFPRVTNCNFRYYGPSGSEMKRNAMCILPQNILNEKIFIVMWFWFILLATLTAMQVVWRVMVAASPMVRIRVLERRGKMSSSPRLEVALRHLHLGDYFLLDILGRNLDAKNFSDILWAATGALDDPNTTYKSFNDGDDDDPLVLKRQMEREETTQV